MLLVYRGGQDDLIGAGDFGRAGVLPLRYPSLLPRKKHWKSQAKKRNSQLSEKIVKKYKNFRKVCCKFYANRHYDVRHVGWPPGRPEAQSASVPRTSYWKPLVRRWKQLLGRDLNDAHLIPENRIRVASQDRHLIPSWETTQIRRPM